MKARQNRADRSVERRHSVDGQSHAGLISVVVAALAIALITAVVWSGTLGLPYYFDDYPTVALNPEIRSLSNIPQFLLHFFNRGALKIGFAINNVFASTRAGQPLPGAFHAGNLLIHVLNAVIAFLLVRLLLRARGMTPGVSTLVASAVALTFALLPLHAMAINLIASRSETQSALFVLVSVYCVGLAAREGVPQRRMWLLLVVAAVALLIALGTKSIGVAGVPLALLIVFYSRQGAIERVRSRSGLLVLGASAVLMAILILALSRQVWQDRYHGVAANLLTQATVVLRYVGLMFVPWKLSIVHDVPLREHLDLASAASLLILLMVTAGGIVLALRRNLLGLTILWYLVAIAPSSSLIPRVERMLEYRTYLAALGLAGALVYLVLAIGAWAARLSRRDAARYALPVIALGVWLAFAAVMTVRTNAVYAAPLKLWARAVEVAPGSARANNNYAQALSEAGRDAEAEPFFRKAIEIDRSYVLAYGNLASMLGRKNDLAGAETILREALAIDPKSVHALTTLGVVLARQGKPAEAEQSYREALALRPMEVMANRNFGDLLAQQGRSEEAMRHYAAALEAMPLNLEAKIGMARELQRAGRAAEALRYAGEALEIDPRSAQAASVQADALFAMQRYAESIHVLRRVVQAGIQDRLVARQLAMMLAACPRPELRDPQGALQLASQLVQGGARSIADLEVYAAALASAGRYAEAAGAIEEALAKVPASQAEQLRPRLEALHGLYRSGQPYVLQ